MTMGGGQPQEIDLIANIRVNAEQFRKDMQGLLGNIPALAAQAAGRASGGSGGGVTEDGQVRDKADIKNDAERSKARTNALKHLAQQFPGGGLMTQMAGAFKSGGIIAGLASGMGAAVGILTGILKSSQVFQTLQNTVFKTLGMMADLFLMPFVPHMMRFVTWMLTHMPQIEAAGQKTVDILSKIWGVLTFGSGQTQEGRERGGVGGFLQRGLGVLTSPEMMMMGLGAGMMATGVGTAPGAMLFGAGATKMAASMATGGYQMGGKVPGSPGEGVPTMLHGGEIIVPQDIAAGAGNFGGRVASWIERFQQKEMGPNGVMAKWYDEMFGHSIIPEMWGSIRGLFTNIEDEASNMNRQVGSTTSSIDEDQGSFWSKLKFWTYFDDGWNLIKNALSGIGEKLSGVFSNFNIDLPDLPAPDFGALTEKMSQIGSNIKDWIGNAIDFAIPGFPKVLFSWGAIWECLKDVASHIGGFFTDMLPSAAVRAYNGIKNGATSAFRGLGNLGGKVIDCFKDAAGAVGNFFFNTIPNKLMGVVRNILDWTPSWGNVWSGIESAFNALQDGVKAAANKVTGGISGAWSWITGNAFGRLSGSGTFRAPRRRQYPMGGGSVGSGVVVTADDGDGGTVTTGGEAGSQNPGGLGAASVPVPPSAPISPPVGTQAQVNPFMTEEDIDVFSSGSFGRSGTYYSAPTQMIASGIHSRGRAFGRLGRGGAGGGVAVANRTVNISINSNQSVADIVKDVERLQTMDEASFFNGVF